MKKYVTAYLLALQQVLQKRATLAMDRLGGIAVVLSLYYFWAALLSQKDSFLGYSHVQMMSYVLVMNFLRSFVFTGRGWELVGEISSGRISSYLVRPLSYRNYSLALDLAQKTVHAAAAVLEIAILMAVIGVPLYNPEHASTWPFFIAALLLSSLNFFLMEFIVSSLAFWTSESAGPLFCFELFMQFISGAFFPLDVLPQTLQKAMQLTPFPYLVFYPINIYLERAGTFGAMRCLAIEGFWLLIFLAAARWVWDAGLENYSAEGG